MYTDVYILYQIYEIHPQKRLSNSSNANGFVKGECELQIF